MSKSTVFIILSVFVLSLVSCAHGEPPVVPDNQNGQVITKEATDSISKISWGIWDIRIDPVNSSVDIVPLRQADFTANVTKFLQPPVYPLNLLKVKILPGSSLPDGKVLCDITINHPFPGSKFSGFDVTGIVMDDYDPVAFQSDSTLTASLPPNTLLSNPDGWTRWWNHAEFTTFGTLFGYTEGSQSNKAFDSSHTLNAYKYFSDDLDADEIFNPDADKRGFFSSINPGLNTRFYDLQFETAPGKKFNFEYAISANWVAPFDYAVPPYEAEDFPESANMAEAYFIGLQDNGSTAYYQNSASFGGDLNLFITVRDWQIAGQLSNVGVEIEKIIVESPTLFDTPFEANLDNVSTDDGVTYKFPFTAENVTPTDINDQLLLVTVVSDHVVTYAPQIPGITGFVYPHAPLSAYNILEAPISASGPDNQPPVADASASNPTEGDAPLTVNLDPSLSHDPDGVVVLFEWDFESDGIYDTSSPNPDIVVHSFDEGTHTVTLRVTDDDSATDTDELIIHSGCYSGPDWHTFRHDNMRTGRSSVAGPLSDAAYKFTWDVPDAGDKAIMSGIVFDYQNRALFRCNNGYLYCVDSSGTLAWSYNVGGAWDYCTPSVDKDGKVYVGNTIGQLYCFDSDGNYLWMQNYGYDSIGGGIAVQDDGTILFTTHAGYLVKTDSAGNELWKFLTGYTMPDGPSVGSDGRIYIANHGGRVYAVNQTGGQVWMTQVGPSEMSATPALGPNGLYIGDWGGNVYGLDYDGGIMWTKHLSAASISCFPSVDCNGNIYIGSRDYNMYCLDDMNGDIKWQYPTAGEIGTMSPVLDGSGHVYVGCYSGHFYCLTTDGGLVWDKDLGLTDKYMYCKSPALDSDGTIITGSNQGVLFAWKD